MLAFIFIYGLLLVLKVRRKSDVQWNQNVTHNDQRVPNKTYTITDHDEIELMFVIDKITGEDESEPEDNINDYISLSAFYETSEEAQLPSLLIPKKTCSTDMETDRSYKKATLSSVYVYY